VRAIYDQDGALKELQGVGRDLTEQKLAEEALGQANKKLHQLASITRHDVMNQLTVAHGFVSISKMEASDPKVLEHLSKAETALRSIQGHLEFTRDYQRMGMAQPVWIPLEDTIEKAASPLRSNGIDVVLDVQDFEVYADPLVEKVFYNLLDNAQRHGGKVKNVLISCRPEGNGLLLVFQDDGKGVSAQDKDRIFEAGYGSNTGYGLFLAREILGTSNMIITETGEEGKGARFEITFPPGKFRRMPPST
jgi:signal transduction histidine kinase